MVLQHVNCETETRVSSRANEILVVQILDIIMVKMIISGEAISIWFEKSLLQKFLLHGKFGKQRSLITPFLYLVLKRPIVTDSSSRSTPPSPPCHSTCPVVTDRRCHPHTSSGWFCTSAEKVKILNRPNVTLTSYWSWICTTLWALATGDPPSDRRQRRKDNWSRACRAAPRLTTRVDPPGTRMCGCECLVS